MTGRWHLTLTIWNLAIRVSTSHTEWGSGKGDWWLRITSDSDIVVQSFIRTSDGFLTSMHDVLPKVTVGREWYGYVTNTFNPASNTNQVSALRFINTSNEQLWGIYTTGGVDDDRLGGSSRMGSPSRMYPYQAANITAQELEDKAHPNNKWSEKRGKRRVVIHGPENDRLLEHFIVMHIMESPTGHVTNLSTQSGSDSVLAQGLVEPLPPKPEPPSGDVFNIDLVFNSDVSQQVKDATHRAAARWENVILEGHENITASVGEGNCGDNDARVSNKLIDDFLVFVSTQDQIEGAVAQGGWCYADRNEMPRYGYIRFDADWLENDLFASSDMVENVAVHEIGHALGFAQSYFVLRDLYGSSPRHFSGNWARSTFLASNHRLHYDGPGVPLSDDGSHWHEDLSIENREVKEIMLAEASTSLRIGKLTLAALGDLGYRVDITRAEVSGKRSATSSDRRVNLSGDAQ